MDGGNKNLTTVVVVIVVLVVLAALAWWWFQQRQAAAPASAVPAVPEVPGGVIPPETIPSPTDGTIPAPPAPTQ